MEYIAAFLALLIGFVLGWLISRLSNAKTSENLIRVETINTEVSEKNARLEAESLKLKTELKTESESRAKAEAVLASMNSYTAMLEDTRQRLTGIFGEISINALKQNSELFSGMAEGTLKTVAEEMKGDIAKRQEAINGLVKPVKEALEKYETGIREIESQRKEAYGSIKTTVEELAKANAELQKQTTSLVYALKAPQVRGRWGEITLKRVVEIAGMSDFCDFTEQVSLNTEDGRLRPDMTVNLPQERTIVIDSKVPLASFIDAFSTANETERNALMLKHAEAVKAHLKALGSKEYWKHLSPSPDFVVLFLPGESFFSAALEQDTSLIEEGMKNRVILATPTTLLALLRTVALSWQERHVTESAQKVFDQGIELYNRLITFTDNFKKLRDGLSKATDSFNQMLGSWEKRVEPCAEKLKEMGGLKELKNLPEIEPVETRLKE